MRSAFHGARGVAVLFYAESGRRAGSCGIIGGGSGCGRVGDCSGVTVRAARVVVVCDPGTQPPGALGGQAGLLVDAGRGGPQGTPGSIRPLALRRVRDADGGAPGSGLGQYRAVGPGRCRIGGRFRGDPRCDGQRCARSVRAVETAQVITAVGGLTTAVGLSVAAVIKAVALLIHSGHFRSEHPRAMPGTCRARGNRSGK